VSGMNDSQILLQEIFRWGKSGGVPAGEGRLVPTGIPSRFAGEEGRPWD
jgi:hypothetical protein